jgi:hypothetical protein
MTILKTIGKRMNHSLIKQNKEKREEQIVYETDAAKSNL